MEPERILGEGGEGACRCGNTSISDGFAPCDSNGAEGEPTPEGWDGIRYVCGRCGRIFDQNTGRVLRQREQAPRC
jgi:hypothetical protein